LRFLPPPYDRFRTIGFLIAGLKRPRPGGR
jgi:hypothetical protein